MNCLNLNMSIMTRRGLKGKSKRAWSRVLFGDPCSYCRDAISTTRDHIYPYSLGFGAHLHLGFRVDTWENWTGACKACNEAKADKLLIMFLLESHNATNRL